MDLIASLKKSFARLNRRPRVCRRLGAVWFLDPSDWLDLRILARVDFEAAQLKYLQSLITRFRPSRFLDCGANIGIYSVLLARANCDLQIDAFEPVDTTRARLVSNIGLNELTDRVTVHALALSNAMGTAEIEIDPHKSGVSTLSATAWDREDRNFARRQIVSTVCLDDFLGLTGERLAFKIDVERHELAVLEGMERTLHNNACLIQIETRDDNRTAVDEWFRARGYHRLAIISEDTYFSSEPI